MKFIKFPVEWIKPESEYSGEGLADFEKMGGDPAEHLFRGSVFINPNCIGSINRIFTNNDRTMIRVTDGSSWEILLPLDRVMEKLNTNE